MKEYQIKKLLSDLSKAHLLYYEKRKLFFIKIISFNECVKYFHFSYSGLLWLSLFWRWLNFGKAILLPHQLSTMQRASKMSKIMSNCREIRDVRVELANNIFKAQVITAVLFFSSDYGARTNSSSRWKKKSHNVAWCSVYCGISGEIAYDISRSSNTFRSIN